MDELVQYLTEEHRKRVHELIAECKLTSNNSITGALDSADTTVRGINTSALLHRHAWLHISGFKSEVQQTLWNVSFDKEHLFGPQVDQALKKMKKETEVAKSMVAIQIPTPRGSFRRSSYRAGSKAASSDASSSSSSSYCAQSRNSPSQGYYRGTYRGNDSKGRGSGGSSRGAASTMNQ